MDVQSLKTSLLDLSKPIAMRTHAAFHLRTLGTTEAVEVICEALLQREDSELMRHELAYILGQMRNNVAIPVLTKVLEDLNDDVLVRHEAAEALGAIGNIAAKDTLERYLDDAAVEVRETCRLAVDLLIWGDANKAADDVSSSSSSVFNSIDPAPAEEGTVSTEELAGALMDTSQSLFKRYRAMFALRNQNTDDSALALVRALSDSSALVRHEIAYVLGQMQRSCTVPGLAEVLRDTKEHRMVRHEAAEALGAIGGTEATEALKPFLEDEEAVVKESCDVALDTIDYWATGFAAGAAAEATASVGVGE